jgi:hypothetical protein
VGTTTSYHKSSQFSIPTAANKTSQISGATCHLIRTFHRTPSPTMSACLSRSWSSSQSFWDTNIHETIPRMRRQHRGLGWPGVPHVLRSVRRFYHPPTGTSHQEDRPASCARNSAELCLTFAPCAVGLRRGGCQRMAFLKTCHPIRIRGESPAIKESTPPAIALQKGSSITRIGSGYASYARYSPSSLASSLRYSNRLLHHVEVSASRAINIAISNPGLLDPRGV